MPGAFTPTEILTAWEAGADIVKVFPADVLGPAFFKALRGPLPQIRVMPTGGVDLTTAAGFPQGRRLLPGRRQPARRAQGRGRARLRPHPRAGPAICRRSSQQTRARDRTEQLACPTTSSPSARRWSASARRNFRRLEQAASLDLQVGGAELNTAVGLARLGRSSRLGVAADQQSAGPADRQPGPRSRRRHRARRLDRRRPRRRLLPRVRRRPAASSVLYDRKGAAIANIKPGMVPWEKVFARRQVVSCHRHHAGPEPDRRRDDARGAAWPPAPPACRTSIDLNYRVKLWSQAEAGKVDDRSSCSTATC